MVATNGVDIVFDSEPITSTVYGSINHTYSTANDNNFNNNLLTSITSIAYGSANAVISFHWKFVSKLTLSATNHINSTWFIY